MQKLTSGGTGRKCQHPDTPDIARHCLHSNPAPRPIPPRPASSNVSCRMLPLSQPPTIAKTHLPTLSCLRLLTSSLLMTWRSLQTLCPASPPSCSLRNPPLTHAFLLTTSRSPYIYFLVRQTFPDSLPFCSIPSNLIVYPPVCSGHPPTLSLFTVLLP